MEFIHKKGSRIHKLDHVNLKNATSHRYGTAGKLINNLSLVTSKMTFCRTQLPKCGTMLQFKTWVHSNFFAPLKPSFQIFLLFILSK